MLRRAVWDFAFNRDAKPGTPQYAWAVSAAGWIWWDGDEDIDEFCRPTFKYVCSVLGLDYAAVRRATLLIKPEDAARLDRLDRDKGE